MKIVISGSSGFVGQALVEDLRQRGHRVVRLVREVDEAQRPDHVVWDPSQGRLDSSVFEGVDAVVNLNGTNIGGGRWTSSYKDELRSSRLEATDLLAGTMASLEDPPKVLINASATGFYGNSGDEVLTEEASAGDGFLADLTGEWEGATRTASVVGIRVVLLRLGMVVGPGGALGRMLLPFKMGLGGPIGNGRQWWPWIAMDDVIGAVAFALDHDQLSGPINLVSPEETTSRGVARTLGRVLHRPAFLPAPAFAVRLLAGEMADALLLSSARVQPKVLERAGYQFAVPSLEAALSHAVQWHSTKGHSRG